jgi:hypothetical protein
MSNNCENSLWSIDRRVKWYVYVNLCLHFQRTVDAKWHPEGEAPAVVYPDSVAPETLPPQGLSVSLCYIVYLFKGVSIN